MTNALYPPARPQSVGEVLDLAFRIFGATLLKCLPFAALAVIAGQLPNAYTLASGQPLLANAQLALQRFFDPKFWLLELVAIFLTVTLTNAVVLRQYALITAQPGTGGAALSAGARHAPGMVLIWILIGFALAGLFIVPLLLVGAAFGSLKAGGGNGIGALSGVALLLEGCARAAPLETASSSIPSQQRTRHLTIGSPLRPTARSRPASREPQRCRSRAVPAAAPAGAA